MNNFTFNVTVHEERTIENWLDSLAVREDGDIVISTTELNWIVNEVVRLRRAAKK